MDIKEVLYYFSIDIERETENSFMVKCPFHKKGQELHASCGVHKEKGFFHCFSCGSSGVLELFLSKKTGKHICEIQDILKSNFGTVYDIDIKILNDMLMNQLTENTEYKENIDFLDEKVLFLYQGFHPYILNRGITKKTIKEFEIGYDRWWKMITFPVRDESNNLVGIVGRSIYEDFTPKYFFYDNFKKGNYLYLLNKWSKPAEYLILVEGVLDALWLYQIGVKNVVASFGVNVTKKQLNLICNYTDTLYVCFDNDQAGVEGRNKISSLLEGKTYVFHIILPEKFKDPVGILKPQWDKCFEEALVVL